MVCIALIHWEVKVGGTSMKDVGGAVLAGSTPPFLGRERAAVDVDVGPERRSPRYHETYLALESIKEGSAAVSKPRGVWLRVHIFKDLEKARRLPVRVEEQQAQQLAVNPPRSAGDGRQEIQLTAMVPIELPVLGNLACRLDVDVEFAQKQGVFPSLSDSPFGQLETAIQSAWIPWPQASAIFLCPIAMTPRPKATKTVAIFRRALTREPLFMSAVPCVLTSAWKCTLQHSRSLG